MWKLKKLYLANNDFKGRIHFSLTTLPRLRDLMLQNNQFEGAIPVFVNDKLTIVDFSNNHLRGPIPKRLQKFPASQFTGNSELCGPPLKKCKPEIPTSTIILIASVVVGALAAITAAFLILRKFGPSSKDTFQVPPSYVKGTPSDHDEFVKHMKRFGKVNHPNLVPLIALQKADVYACIPRHGFVSGSGGFGSGSRGGGEEGEIVFNVSSRFNSRCGEWGSQSESIYDEAVMVFD